MSTLERAVAIAATAHEGQRDKADAPYILHPLRVMLRLTSEAERITAVLHDVVEDCEGWSFARKLRRLRRTRVQKPHRPPRQAFRPARQLRLNAHCQSWRQRP